jgi:Lon protease-like protein
MDDLARITAALSRLPIFPLPGAVLLPHGVLPLHIFEPRYRAMTHDCLPRNGGHNALALAQVVPASLRAGEDPPRVLPIIGVGTLVRLEELPDGRFNLVLKGILRARIVEELPSTKPYRLVRAVALVDDPAEERDRQVIEIAESLRRLILALCAAQPGPAAQSLAQMSARVQEPGRLADLLAGSLIEAPSDRQAVLEALRVKARLTLVSQAVGALLAQATPRAEAKGGFLN